MSGYDRSRFSSLTDEDYEELKCGICLGVFNKPLVTQCCQQTYCTFCITQWIRNSKTCPNDRKQLTQKKLQAPPRFSVNILNNLLISCDHKDNGCDESVKLGQLSHHLANCRFNPQNRCQKCGESKSGDHKCGEALNATIVSLRQELDELRKANLKLKNSLAANKTKQKDLEIRFAEELSEKDVELVGVKTKIIELKSECDCVRKQCNDLTKDNNELRQQTKAFFEENESFKSQIKQLRQHCDTLLEDKDARLKLESDLNTIRQQNVQISEQYSSCLSDLQNCRLECDSLRANSLTLDDHVKRVMDSAKESVNSPVIIKCKLSSKVTQVSAMSVIKDAICKCDTFKEMADTVKRDMEKISRGMAWNAIVYSNSCCHSLNYVNDNLIDVTYGQLRIKLISA